MLFHFVWPFLLFPWCFASTKSKHSQLLHSARSNEPKPGPQQSANHGPVKVPGKSKANESPPKPKKTSEGPKSTDVPPKRKALPKEPVETTDLPPKGEENSEGPKATDPPPKRKAISNVPKATKEPPRPEESSEKPETTDLPPKRKASLNGPKTTNGQPKPEETPETPDLPPKQKASPEKSPPNLDPGVNSGNAKIINVLNFGAVADNKTDIGPALTKAIASVGNAKTANAGATVILIPKGDYNLASNVVFQKSSSLTFTINGDLYMPYDPNLRGTMITFIRCNNIIVNGNGKIYGNGYRYRPNGNLGLNPARPRLVRFEFCDNVDYSGVGLYDSPMFHLSIVQGNNFHVHNFEVRCTHIGATDGIVSSGTNAYIHDVLIENGDECVTAKTPMVGMKVENVVCIFTTGCAIGSFGANEKDYLIKNIDYRNVTLTHASNGMTIKSYPSASGIIKNLTYTDFKLTEVAYPIKLDFSWGAQLHTTNAHWTFEAKQLWSDFTYTGFSGTGTPTRSLISLNCPKGSPCTGMNFKNIRLTGSTKPANVSFACGTVDSISRVNLPNLPAC